MTNELHRPEQVLDSGTLRMINFMCQNGWATKPREVVNHCFVYFCEVVSGSVDFA